MNLVGLALGVLHAIERPALSLGFGNAFLASVGLGPRGFAAVHVAFCLARNDPVCAHCPDPDERAALGAISIWQGLAFVIQAPLHHLGAKFACATFANALKVRV